MIKNCGNSSKQVSVANNITYNAACFLLTGSGKGGRYIFFLNASGLEIVQ